MRAAHTTLCCRALRRLHLEREQEWHAAFPRSTTATSSNPSAHIFSPCANYVTTTRPESTSSARLRLRDRSSTFVPIDPTAIFIPTTTLNRINNTNTTTSQQLDDNDDDTDDSSEVDDDDDPATLVDRSTSARRTLFATLRRLHARPPATVSPDYAATIIDALTLHHQPLLPREQAHVAALCAHTGREVAAVQWVGRLLAAGWLTVEWAELVRSRAERAGLVGLEERMRRIVHTLQAERKEGAGEAAVSAGDAGVSRGVAGRPATQLEVNAPVQQLVRATTPAKTSKNVTAARA